MKVLFVTQHLDKICGIGIIGKLFGDALSKSNKHQFETFYCESNSELENKINEFGPRVVIYNYHSVATPWVNDSKLRDNKTNIDFCLIHHDMHQAAVNEFKPNSGIKYLISPDNTLNGSDYVFTCNRLIPNYEPAPYIERGVPVIGFQGFGPPHKGIAKIAHQVALEFDQAIIRLHIPPSHYGEPLVGAKARVEEVKSIVAHKKEIIVESSHDFLDTQGIVNFLGQNTINCYFYDYLDGAGLASSPDYALAAKRPIAVTKSHQLRNFIGLKPSVFIEDNSLRDIISFGTKPLEELYEKYSEESFIKDYESIIDKICEND